jgi:large subunit ribosomal protein L11
MSKEVVDALVEGGKASAAPPLGPALGPKGVNIGLVIAEINKKTAAFKGMQVPVKVIIDSDTKAFEITIGTPPASELIKKEAGIEKGSGNPLDHLADIKIVQVIKIAKMKEDALSGKTLKDKIKEVIGTCNSMGVMVEEMHARDAIKAVNAGKFDKEIASGKTELTAEELKQIGEERKKLQEEIAARREEFLTKAKSVMKEMEGKESKIIRKHMEELEIPESIINELVPLEKSGGGAGAKGGKPAAAAPAGKAPAKK